MTPNQPPDPQIAKIIKNAKVIAVVGLSPNPDRDSYQVAHYLIINGFKVYGVNPAHSEILGRPCLPFLTDIRDEIDIVDIFRNPSAMPGIVADAIASQAKCVWMQLGLAHEQAAQAARKAGLEVVMNKCLKVEHMHLR